MSERDSIPALAENPPVWKPVFGYIGLSCEPLLGPVDLKRWLIDWVIAGGESGHGARPMHPDWVRSLCDQCQAAGVPFFFKQWGEFRPACQIPMPPIPAVRSELMEDGGASVHCYRVGKKDAGRLLDGREWNEFPQEVAAHA